MSPAAADGDGRRAPQLTRRQVEILCLVATGASNRAIGEQLGLREQTVKNHLWEATRKLGVDDRTHAVLEAMRLEIIEVPVDPTAPLMAIPIEPWPQRPTLCRLNGALSHHRPMMPHNSAAFLLG